MNTALRARAQLAAVECLRTLKPHTKFSATPSGYLEDWHENLITGVTPADFEADLRQGDGNELADRNGQPAKFRAAFSSSALAVNVFGPFRQHPRRLTFLGMFGLEEVHFEFKCKNGLRGKKPNLDLCIRASDRVIGIESKFLETLASKVAIFSDQYDAPFKKPKRGQRIVEAPWARLFQDLRDDPCRYVHLDAAQLVKHYLGLWHSFPAEGRTLVYLFWEPTNAASLAEYRKHADEIADFSQRVADCETRFVALSYRQLCDEWIMNSLWLGLDKHIGRIRERYEFSI